MKCLKCQFDNREEASFCSECGHKFELICPECGNPNRLEAKFCDKCGHNLSNSLEPISKELSFEEKIEKIQKYLPKGLTDKILSQKEKIEGERKEVTVMFCDMFGFTPLVEKLGAEDAYKIMDKIYEILIHKVSEFQGTINEMTGDGVMALFGAPIALENAPQRTIQSALAIHREITKFNDSKKSEGHWSPIKLRIGIHTGPVVVGTLGNDLRVEFKAVGETVILASRMESLSEPGTTYVTEDTFKLTEGFFRFESLGEQQIKGKEGLVSVYQVLAPSTRSTRFEVNAERGLSAFVGRQRELELLMDGYERVKQGRGQAFSIIAEAGVGKTRLVYEFRKSLANEDVSIREGRCLSYSQNEAYHPIVDVLKSHFNIGDTDSEFQIKEKVRNALKIMNGEQISLMPYLLELLKVKDSGIDKVLSPEERKRRFISALKQLILKGSELRPTVLIIEDLHWIDKTSEEVLKDLFESIAGSYILLLFTYRPEYIHTWGAKTFHSQVTLNRLSNRESLMMVSNLLDNHEIDPVLQDLILEKTEGVPFFIEELIKSLVKLKVIEKKDNRYQLSKDFQQVAIPSTIQDVIMARVDALPERAKEVIQAGSAIEREFSYELIRHIVGMPQEELLSNLSILKDLELIYERGIYPKSTYIFKHALTQEVVYSSILKDRAKKFHETIALAMETMYADRLEDFYETLAYQYSQSENHQKAFEYLKLSGTKAFSNYANQESYMSYKGALNSLKKLPDSYENKKAELEVSLLMLNPIPLIGFPDEAKQILHQSEMLAKELGDKESLAYFYNYIVGYYFMRGNLKEGISYGEPIFIEAINHQDLELAAAMSNALIVSYAMMGQYKKITEIFPGIINLLEKNKKEHENFGAPYNLYAYLCSYYGVPLAYIGRFEEAKIYLIKGANYAKNLNNTINTMFSEYMYGHYYLAMYDAEKAVEKYQAAGKYAELTSFPMMLGQSLGFLGCAQCFLGELDVAKSSIERGYELVKKSNTNAMISIFPLFLSYVYHDLKDLQKAKYFAEQAINFSVEFYGRQFEALARISMGRIIGKISNINILEAQKCVLEGIEILKEIMAGPSLTQSYFILGELYANSGRKDEAINNLNKALSMCQEMKINYWPDKIREVLDRL